MQHLNLGQLWGQVTICFDLMFRFTAIPWAESSLAFLTHIYRPVMFSPRVTCGLQGPLPRHHHSEGGPADPEEALVLWGLQLSEWRDRWGLLGPHPQPELRQWIHDSVSEYTSFTLWFVISLIMFFHCTEFNLTFSLSHSILHAVSLLTPAFKLAPLRQLHYSLRLFYVFF